MKKLFVFVMVLSMLGAMIPSAFAGTYGDVADDHWASPQIEKWSARDIIKGSDGSFRPSDNITRGEFAVILDRIMKYPQAATNGFDDLDQNFYTESILKANYYGIMQGYGSNIRPRDFITRQEACVMLTRALDYQDSLIANPFSDSSDIATWALGSINSLAEKQIIQGYEGMFRPNDNITRAEVITIIDNAIVELWDDAETYSDVVDGNVVVNTSGAYLKDVSINGDLIIADGVADGEVVLDNVVVSGRLFVRGGGSNSIVIRGDSRIMTTLINKKGGEPVSIKVEGQAECGRVELAEGSKAIIIGDVLTLILASNVDITLADGASVVNVEIQGDNVIITVDNGASIETITITGNKVTVTGNGEVKEAVIEEGTIDVTIETKGTTITNKGEETIPSDEKTATNNNNPAGGGNTNNPGSGTGGGGTGGGGGNNRIADVQNQSEFIAAINNDNIDTVRVAQSFVFDGDIWNPRTLIIEIPKNVSFTLASSSNMSFRNGSIKIDGTVTVGVDNYVGITSSISIKSIEINGLLDIRGYALVAVGLNSEGFNIPGKIISGDNGEIRGHEFTNQNISGSFGLTIYGSVAGTGILNGILKDIDKPPNIETVLYTWSNSRWNLGNTNFSASNFDEFVQLINYAKNTSISTISLNLTAPITITEDLIITSKGALGGLGSLNITGEELIIASGVTVTISQLDWTSWSFQRLVVNGTLQHDNTLGLFEIYVRDIVVNGTMNGVDTRKEYSPSGIRAEYGGSWKVIAANVSSILALNEAAIDSIASIYIIGDVIVSGQVLLNSIWIEEGCSLTVSLGAELTINAIINVYGSLINNGIIIGINGSSHITNAWERYEPIGTITGLPSISGIAIRWGWTGLEWEPIAVTATDTIELLSALGAFNSSPTSKIKTLDLYSSSLGDIVINDLFIGEYVQLNLDNQFVTVNGNLNIEGLLDCSRLRLGAGATIIGDARYTLLEPGKTYVWYGGSGTGIWLEE